MADMLNPLDPLKRYTINLDGTPSEVPSDLPVINNIDPAVMAPPPAPMPEQGEQIRQGAGTALAKPPAAETAPPPPADQGGGVNTGVLTQLRNRSLTALDRLDRSNAEIEQTLAQPGGPIDVGNQAANELAKIAAVEERAKAAADQAKLDAEQKYIANSQRMSDAARIKTETAMADAANMDAEYKNTKIDPSRFWAGKSTASKVLAGIGIALGALGQTLTGKPNGALEIFNQAIDEDIAAQKEQLGRLKEASSSRLNDIGRYRMKLNDDMAAELLARSNAWTKIEKAYSEQLAMINPAKVTQQQLLQQAQLQQKAAEAKQAAADEHYKKEIDSTKQAADIEKNRLELGLKSNEQKQSASPGQKGGVLRPMSGTMPTKEDEDKAKAIYAKVAPAVNDANELEKLITKLASMDKITMDTPEAQRAGIIAKKMPYQIGASLGQGALSKEQTAEFAQMVANPAAFDFTGRGPALIRGLRQNINDNVNASLNAYNMEMNTPTKADPNQWQAD